MLPTTYRIQAVNNTGVALTASDVITIKAKRWNLSTTGTRVAESAEALLTAAGAGNSLASGDVVNTATQDNSTLGWFGGDFSLLASVNTATPNGTVDFYLQASTDAGTTWPNNAAGELIRSIAFTAVGTKNRQVIY